jgi:D-alanine-D-alanine ligase
MNVRIHQRNNQKKILNRPTTFDHPITVLILYYKGSKEDDQDTQENAKGIAEALKKRGHAVRKMIVTNDNWRKAIRIPADIVFNIVEDDTWELYLKIGYGLEKSGRAQVGQDTKGFRYVIRKAWIKRRMEKVGIATPAYTIFTRKSKIAATRKLNFPLIVKPSEQHAGIGITQKSVVRDITELRQQVGNVLSDYPGEVVAEEFVKGREIHVTVLGNDEDLVIFPFCEIGFNGNFSNNWSVYTYKAKWDKKSWEYSDARVHAPAEISKALHEKISKLVVDAFHAFDCRDIVRFDIRVDAKDRPFLVDINMNPSLNVYDTEDATLASVYASGWTYEEFIETLVQTTYKRCIGR